MTSIFSPHGSALLVPRELGLVRVYVQLPDDYILRKGYEPEEAVTDIMSTARKIMVPYTIDYRYCDWFTIYPVAQKMCKTYSFENRVFLAGDAVHSRLCPSLQSLTSLLTMNSTLSERRSRTECLPAGLI